MSDEMSHSPTLAALAVDLAKAQGQFGRVTKEADNPYYNSRYADLASLIEATRGPLAAHSLVVVQTPVVLERQAGVTTLLLHGSGEWIRHTLLLPAESRGKDGTLRFDAQSTGSAITYARRYAYQAVLNIAADDDDDGNAAVGNRPGPTPVPTRSTEPNRGHGREEMTTIQRVEQPDGAIRAEGALTRVERKTSKKGSPFLSIKLGDVPMFVFDEPVMAKLEGHAGQSFAVLYREKLEDGRAFRTVTDAAPLAGAASQPGRQGEDS